MLDGILSRFGVDKSMIGRIGAAAIGEMAAVGGDKLAASLESNVKAFAREFALKTREDLISALAGPMPPTFVERLKKRGYNDITDAQAQDLWRDCIAARADEPVEAVA